MKLYLGLLLLIIALGITNAWTQETSVYIAKQVLIEKYPGCALEIEQGVKNVYNTEKTDMFLGEPENMHCDTMQCLAFSPLYCKTQNKTCQSESKSGSVKTEAQELCDCDQAEKLSEAVTYFISKYNPFNVMVNESAQCKNDFNNAVNFHIKNETNWNIEIQCDSPNIKLTFDKKRFDEIITNAKSFAFGNAFAGTNPWYCYTLDINNETEQNQLKNNGELCVSNTECESDYCNNRVCCAGGLCCPNPEVKGYPCMQGQKCNNQYICEYLEYSSGNKCQYSEECSSGNCAYNMIGDNAYCTSQGESYGCLNNNDCLSGYECKSYSVMNEINYLPEQIKLIPEKEYDSKILTRINEFKLKRQKTNPTFTYYSLKTKKLGNLIIEIIYIPELKDLINHVSIVSNALLCNVATGAFISEQNIKNW